MSGTLFVVGRATLVVLLFMCVTTSCCFPNWIKKKSETLRYHPNDAFPKTAEPDRTLPKVHVNPDGWFTDNSGRVLMLHGLNSVMKSFPWYNKALLNETVLEYFRQWGFNVMRLGTMWSGVEPRMNAYNETYIKILETIVDKLADKGIYTFLDMHQDVMSQRFGTYDGFPHWLVDMLPKPRHPYPWPFPDAKFSSWAEQYLTEGCCTAFQGFYENYNGTLSHFAQFWKKIAADFRGKNGVLGYELINEPWPGNVLADPTLFAPGNAGRRNLLPAYDLLHKAIRSVDNETIILFEPVTWGVLFNGKYAGTGFDHVPGGAAYKNRTALSYHLYCWILNPADAHKPYPTWKKILCDDIWAVQLFKTAVSDIKSLGCGGLLTEFGNCQPDKSQNSTNTIECERVMTLADQHLQSWTYWDVIFFNDKGEIQWDIAKPFIRTYARAIAGTPLSTSYDVKTYVFRFSYSLNTQISAPTEIFVPNLHYPRGFSVKVSSGIAWAYDSKNFVVLLKPNRTLADGTVVTVQIAPKPNL